MSFPWNGGSRERIKLPNANFCHPQPSSRRLGEASAEKWLGCSKKGANFKNHKRVSDICQCPRWTLGFLLGQCQRLVAKLTCRQG